MFVRSLQMIAGFVLFAFLAFHTAMIAEYNLPSNLLEPALSKVVDRYVVPYFGQNWSLFAPNPGGTVLAYRIRFRLVFDDHSVVVTPYVESTDVFPASQSGPFDRLSLFREISYSCSNLAENLVAKGQVPKFHATSTVDPDKIDAPTSCLARLSLAMAPAFAAQYGKPASRLLSAATQVQYLVARGEHVSAALRRGMTIEPLKYRVVATTPWLDSSDVTNFPTQIEVSRS